MDNSDLNAVRGGPSHGHKKRAQRLDKKIGRVVPWIRSSTERRTDTHTDADMRLDDIESHETRAEGGLVERAGQERLVDEAAGQRQRGEVAQAGEGVDVDLNEAAVGQAQVLERRTTRPCDTDTDIDHAASNTQGD